MAPTRPLAAPDAPTALRCRRKKFLSAEELAAREARYLATMAKSKADNEAAAAAAGGVGVASASGGVQLSQPIGSAEFPKGPLIILWGSQTGTAESFGKVLMEEARQRGFDATSTDLEEYDHEKLAEEDEVRAGDVGCVYVGRGRRGVCQRGETRRWGL